MVTDGDGSRPASRTADLAAPEGVPRALGDLRCGARDRLAIGAMVALSHRHSSASADNSAVSTWPAGARPAPALLADRRARQDLQPRVAARPAGDRHLHRPALPRLLPARGEHPHRGRGQARAERARDRLGQRRPLGRHRAELPRGRRPLEARPDLALGDRNLRRARPRLEALRRRRRGHEQDDRRA